MAVRQTRLPQINRPGFISSDSTQKTADSPGSVIFEALLSGGASVVEAQLFTGALAAGETLGALETIAIFGATLSGAGAIVLLTAGVGAVFLPSVRAQLQPANKAIGVVTSPAGLSTLVGAEALGYSFEDALKGGEAANALFSAYSADRALETGIKNWREAALFAKDVKDVIGYVKDHPEDADDNDDGLGSPKEINEYIPWSTRVTTYFGPAAEDGPITSPDGSEADPSATSGKGSDEGNVAPPGNGEVTDPPSTAGTEGDNDNGGKDDDGGGDGN